MGEATSYFKSKGVVPHYFDDRYEIFSQIGHGRSSVVYLAGKYSKTDTIEIDSPPVALKVLYPERDPDAAIKRIKRESVALLSCIHPNIIRMHDYVAREDACYISMEYAKYGDLKKLSNKKQLQLSSKAILKLVQNILDGVSAIHASGIIHRDLKPDNILLDAEYQIKICDFSVCLLKGEKASLKVVSDVVGTLDYLAPECLAGHGYTEKSDLYSVGVIAFELLANKLPFASKSLSLSLKTKSSLELEQLPQEVIKDYHQLIKFFKKALHPNPQLRFQTAEDMKTAIEAVLSQNFKLDWKVQTEIIKKNVISELLPYIRRSVFNTNNFDLIKSFHFHKLFNKLSRYFVISFLLTIAFFSLANLFDEKSFVKKSTETVATTSLNDQSDLAAIISSTPAIGIIHGLYTTDKDYRFVISPVSNERALFGLLIKGWEPVEFSLLEYRSGKPIHILGKGVDILLKPEGVNENGLLNGSYENLITARMGKWELRLP